MRRKGRIILSSSSSEEELSGNKKLSQTQAKSNWKFDFEEEEAVVVKSKSKPKRIKSTSFPTIESTDPCNEVVFPFEKLIIHKKKLTQLEEWFKGFKERLIKRQSSILVVTGPTGSGKTASIKSLISKFSINCSDGYEFSHNINNGKEKLLMNSQFNPLKLIPFHEEESISAADTDDIESVNDCGKVLLFDDLPHPDSVPILEHLMTNWDSLNSPQMILIFTDPCGLNSSNNSNNYNSLSMYNKIIKYQPQITTIIQFNPVAPSLMKKVDSSFTKRQENIELFGGDIRLMKLNIHFSNLLSTEIDSMKCQVDDTFDVFHLAGKILYPRKSGGEKSIIDPFTIASSNRPFIQSLLHHNYPNFFHSPQSISFISENLSLYDSLDWRLRDDTMLSALPEVAVSFAHFFENPSKEFSFTPIKSPPPLFPKHYHFNETDLNLK